MTPTVATSSGRFSLEYNLKEEIPRSQLPKFRIGDPVRLRTRKFALTSICNFIQRAWQDIQVPSVEYHVKKLEYILCRRDTGQEFLGATWDNFMSTYQLDLSQRIWAVIIQTAPVGEIRQRLIDQTLVAADAVLRAYVHTHGRKDKCCGWVFFILEKSLGEALQQAHQNLPNEAETCDREDVALLVETAFRGLFLARDFAFAAIKRIESGRWTYQERPMFHITGKQLEYPAKSTEHDPEESGEDGLGSDILSLIQQTEADVMIGMEEKTWKQTSEGVAASYVRWRLRDDSTGRFLLGFLPRKTASRLRKVGCITFGLIALSTVVVALALASGNLSQQ